MQRPFPIHPFLPGQRVTIFRLGYFRRPYIEGRARIVSAISGTPDLYRVRFEGERRIRERLAHPGDWQTNPQQLLQQLTAEWQASLTPALLREFFPDEVRLEEAGQ
jgi:hypothetical protein